MIHDVQRPCSPQVGTLPDGARELRRFLRHRVEAEGFTRFDGRSYRLALKDLSEQGCQFRLPWSAKLAPRSVINLRIGDLGPFSATVRWRRDNWIGVEFDIPVYPPVLAHMKSTLGVEGEARA